VVLLSLRLPYPTCKYFTTCSYGCCCWIAEFRSDFNNSLRNCVKNLAKWLNSVLDLQKLFFDCTLSMATSDLRTTNCEVVVTSSSRRNCLDVIMNAAALLDRNSFKEMFFSFLFSWHIYYRNTIFSMHIWIGKIIALRRKVLCNMAPASNEAHAIRHDRIYSIIILRYRIVELEVQKFFTFRFHAIVIILFIVIFF
jgi:hypothetical protein